MMGTRLPQTQTREPLWRTVLLYVACYLWWIALSALGLWLLFQVRTNLVDFAIWLQLNPWVPRTVDRFAIYLLGLLWLGGVIGLEGYLRRGVEQEQLWVRVGRILVMLLIIGAISYGLQLLLRL